MPAGGRARFLRRCRRTCLGRRVLGPGGRRFINIAEYVFVDGPMVLEVKIAGDGCPFEFADFGKRDAPLLLRKLAGGGGSQEIAKDTRCLWLIGLRKEVGVPRVVLSHRSCSKPRRSWPGPWQRSGPP